MTDIKISKNVTTIKENAFAGYGLKSFTVDEDNSAYKSVDGNLYTKDGTVLMRYATGKTESSFTVPEGVTSIENYAFDSSLNYPDYSNSSLIEIKLPKSLKSIGNYAFLYCSKLTSIEIPEGVTSIGVNAFKYCSQLKTINISESVTEIAESEIFYGCENLKTIKLPKHITSIKRWGLSSVKNFIIPDHITSLESWSFISCDITSLVMPKSVTYIDPGAFTSLSSIRAKVENLYYGGTSEEWSQLLLNVRKAAEEQAEANGKPLGADELSRNEIVLTGTNVYFYSENEPTEAGNYWHWSEDGETPVIWE